MAHRSTMEVVNTDGSAMNNHSKAGKREAPFIEFQEFLDEKYPGLSSRMVAQISRYVDQHFSPKRPVSRKRK